MSDSNIHRYNISTFTKAYPGSNGNEQIFKQIKIVLPSSGFKTFDGCHFSEWMLSFNGSLYIPVDDHEVEYSAEYQGENIALMPMHCIRMPAIEDAGMPLGREITEVLRQEISKLFQIECNLPIVAFDYIDPAEAWDGYEATRSKTTSPSFG